MDKDSKWKIGKELKRKPKSEDENKNSHEHVCATFFHDDRDQLNIHNNHPLNSKVIKYPASVI